MTVIPASPPRADGAAPSLVARGLCKRIFGRDAVHDFSIELAAGRVHGVYGAASSGKTTVARLLTGAISPDGGEVLYAGRTLDRFAARRLRVMCTGSDMALLPGRSVAENVYLGCEPRVGGLVARTSMLEDASVLLRTVGATGVLASDRLDSLDAADRLLVECARALAIRARVFVMDEPSLALGHGRADHLWGVIRAMTSAGVAVLVLSADLADLLANCDEVSVL
jgi:ribose transport system ATP-binding protein